MHVLVTRPEPQSSELCQLIIAQGNQATSFPTIAFAPPVDLPAFELLNEQDWLIFISPQAVRETTPHIKIKHPKIAAVGAGTAKALYSAGYTQVLHPEMEWHSEGLLALPQFQIVDGQKIAIIRGAGGRELIDKELRERGANVLTVITYVRILPKSDIEPCLALLKQGIIDVIVCTSYEGVRNLKVMLGEAGWPYLKNKPIIVMSERIKMLAQDLGFQTIWVTRNPSQTAILDLLVE